MTADEALQQLIGASVFSVDGTSSLSDADECLDFLLVTDKGSLIAYATNSGGIAMEWRPAS